MDEKAMKPRIQISFPFACQRAFCFGKPYQPSGNEFLLDHARSGILLALQALHLPAGSGVGVMVYNCHTVFNAISQAGCTPVFLDVRDDLTLDLDDLRSKRTRMNALIVSHLFGILNPVSLIREEFPDLVVIEDCAHAYGLKDLTGDVSVFSIGQGKLPSIGDGGILIVNHPQWKDRFSQLYSTLQEYGRINSVRLFCKLVVKAFLYRPWVYSLLTVRLKRRRKASSGVEKINPSRMSKGIRAVYEVERLHVDKQISGHLENARRLSEEVKKVKGTRLLPLGINAFMLVVQCRDKSALIACMQALGLETDTHFFQCIDWARSFGYRQGDCPKAERLRHQLLMIPVY